MKLRPSLKNSARPALNLPPHQLGLTKIIINWCGGVLIALFLASGCSSSTTPTFLKEGVADAIRAICKNEYKIDVQAKLLGQTLWIYLPVKDLMLKDESGKPEKYAEKFNIERNQNELDQGGTLRLRYLIYPVAEKEKPQEYKDNEEVSEKINNVWKVLRRVLFSMERLKEGEPQFCCLVIADIKNGFDTQYTFFLPDLKKVSYQFISWGEYQHRAIQDTTASPAIIGDEEDRHIDYHDVTLKEFVVRQIEYRIKLKFQKPEVEKNADIDKEIQKIVAETLKIYDFKEFVIAEFNNLFSGATKILSRQEILANPIK